MASHRVFVPKYGAAILLALGLAVQASAATDPSSTAFAEKVKNIRIVNFGRINDNYYRGSQPRGRDFEDLAALGVKMDIDLAEEGRADEQANAERAGMKFVRIPMTTTDTPTAAQLAQFLKLVNDPANQPVYVHCQGGRHRTGVMTAAYRMTQDGWDANRAYAEMKQFRFEGFPGHPVLKQFVFDYYNQVGKIQLAKAPLPEAGAIAGTATAAVLPAAALLPAQ